MNIRIPLLLGLSIVAGIPWSLGSNVSAIAIHFIGPALIAGLVTFLWRSTTWQRQMLLVFESLLLVEIVRLTVSGLNGGWQYITADSETQIWLLASFAIMVVVGFVALGVARLFVQRDEKTVV